MRKESATQQTRQFFHKQFFHSYLHFTRALKFTKSDVTKSDAEMFRNNFRDEVTNSRRNFRARFVRDGCGSSSDSVPERHFTFGKCRPFVSSTTH